MQLNIQILIPKTINGISKKNQLKFDIPIQIFIYIKPVNKILLLNNNH